MSKHLFVICDGLFYDIDGIACSAIMPYEKFASRYRQVFDKVTIVGRLFKTGANPQAKPITGDGVDFIAIDGYHGPVGFLKRLPLLFKIFQQTRKTPNAIYLLRLPALIPSFFGILLVLSNRRFGLEAVGDPFDGYSSAVTQHKLAPLFQRIGKCLLQLLCRHAHTSAYVTARSLQAIYPPGNPERSFNYTSLDLDTQFFATAPRTQFNTKAPRLITVGMMMQANKGIDTLLYAVQHCHQHGQMATLTVIGDGTLRTEYEALSAQLGLSSFVTFTGLLPAGPAVFAELDGADIFVLASRQEGLPRAMIEAMARALPCLGTPVGGIGELIEPAEIFPVNGVGALSHKVLNICRDIEKLRKLSADNLEKAKAYSYDQVSAKRRAMYVSLAQGIVDE